MMLEIPPDVVRSLRLPAARVQDELRREFAVFLVREGLLPQAKACQMAGMERLEFEDLLTKRQVAWPGTLDDVQRDAATADSW